MSHEHISHRFLFKIIFIGFVAGFVGSIFSFFLFPYLRLSIPGMTQRTVLDSEETSVIHLAEVANPAVVSIIIEKEFGPRSVRDIFFDDFIGLLPPSLDVPDINTSSSSNGTSSQLQQIGGGSGFIISTDGLIVTNRHVIADEDAVYTVVLNDGTRYPVTVVAKDPVMDVALVKIEAKNLPTLKLGDSDTLKIGQTVLAIGNALAEYGNTLTKGVISGIGRRVEAGDARGFVEVLEGAIQTDAAINPGNSGGPLLDVSGKVVGINTAVSETGQLLGFAIPINSVRKTIEIVEKEGRLLRPWLGIRYVPITPRFAKEYNLPVTYGVLVQQGATPADVAVLPGSPAEKAGIVENDIIVAINGEKIEDRDSLSQFILKYAIGDTITVTVLHDNEERELKITLEEMPDALTK